MFCSRPRAALFSAFMTLAVRPRPYAVATVLFSSAEADAVRTLLEAIAPDQSLAFLLIEDEWSSVDERSAFRARTTGASRLRSELATANGFVEPNAIYFVPRHRARALLDGKLHFSDETEAPPSRVGLGSFFSSLAGDQGRRGCVIAFAGALGDRQDEAPGLALIAEAGGLVLIQDEANGPFRRVLPVAEQTDPEVTRVQIADLPNVVLEHAEPLIAEVRPSTTSALYRDVEAILPALCVVLLEATGHDFGHYKSSTLIRRTLRRLHLIHCDSAEAYLARLREDRAEATRLFSDLLVSVTAFFRDVEAFEALALLAIPHLFESASRDEPVRVWVAGCATGEEAYSIAMLLREYASGRADLPSVQIFATDLDEHALSVARQGHYPASRLAHVSPERIARFFTRSGASFKVTKEIRDLVLFSRHSVTNDPPFSNVHLVSCRNLLIYLGDELHHRVIPLFYYALRAKGFLFLGPAESLATHQDLFRPIDVKHRISQRVGTARRAAPILTGRTGPSHYARHATTGTTSEAETFRAMQQALVDDFTPRSVVVTDEGHVVAASGNLEAFLTVTAGPFVNSITRLVRDGLRVTMRAALREAVERRERVVHHDANVRTEHGVQRVTITVQPLTGTVELAGLFLVVFQPAGKPISPQASPTPQHTEAANALIERLEVDLATTRDELNRTVQDLEAVNEELKSSNEELLSMNEELQSSNEELESSKDELQAANSAMVDTNSDLANLLASTQIPTIFLDDQVNVRRVTPSASVIYNLVVDDAGRPLDHFTHKAVHMPPLPSSAIVHAAVRPIEDEVEMRDGMWYLRRVLPYVTPAGAHEGIVITFTDVTERRGYERAIRDSEARLRAVIDSMLAFVGVLDVDGTLLEVNRAPLAMGGLTRDEVIGRAFWDCAWWTYDDAVRERLRAAFARAALGEVVRYDAIVRMANDQRVTVDFMLQPVHRDGVLQFVIPSAVDLTHRLEAEAQLRYQRDLTQSITDNATTAIFMTDAGGRCTFANPAAEAMTGYSAAELVGEPLHDRIHHTRPDGSPYPMRECPIDRALPDGNEVHDQEDLFVRKDGLLFPVVCNTRVIHKGGVPTGTVIEVRDVTEERRAAHAVAESQARFHQLAETIPQLAWMAHPDGHIFWYNQRWYDYTGAKLEEMEGWGWTSVHDPEVLPVVMERWRACIVAGTPFDMVFPLLGADGVFRPFLTRVNPFRDAHGAIVLWFGTNTDVSEERAQSEELRRRQRELQTLADNSPDIITRFDRMHRHVFVNAAVELATGMPRGAFIGRTHRELGIPEALCEMWGETIARVFETGQPQAIEFDFDAPDGPRFYLGRFVAELGTDGRVEFALCVTRDRTAERLAELAVHDANQRKDEFLAILAHELRNPLAPVRNGLEVLRLSSDGDTRTAGVREIMERQIVIMTRLIDDLLDISRISLGKVELQREAVTVSSILDAALEVSRPSIELGRHELTVTTPDNSLLLYADSTRVAQVVGNLLRNAAKYTPDGGHIALVSSRDGSDVVIRVSDDGIGIPQTMLTKVFDMFIQIEHPTVKSQGGLGIGLALVRQLVEMHGGTVQAESDGPGLGSTFTVRLPLAPGAPAPVRDGEPTAAETEAVSLRVLVVDDNVDAVESLVTMLSIMGHDTQSAFSGADALEVITSFAPDVIILDIGLPDMSGYEVATKIRSDPALEHLVLVALTGWGSDEHRRRSREAGFDFHLTKPTDSAILGRILTHAATSRAS